MYSGSGSGFAPSFASRDDLPLPPGAYFHSSYFPKIIQSLNPAYGVVVEPVFMDHLLANLNRDIRVMTTSGMLEGQLSSVAIDHLQLTIDGEHYHVRYPQIVYYRGLP